MFKQCTSCGKVLPLSGFYKNTKGAGSVTAKCIDCFKIHRQSWKSSRTSKPSTPRPSQPTLCKWNAYKLTTSILDKQKFTSKRRGYAPPAYTVQELHNWIIAQPNFNSLYQAWVASNYDRWSKPSIDRINDYVSYTFSNIQLTTAKLNVYRSHTDKYFGINTKVSHAVDQFDMDGLFIKRHHSISSAGRAMGKNNGNGISRACNNQTTQAYGYRWKYSAIPNNNTEIK